MSEADVSRTFVVVPFERVGLKVGPRQALVVDAPAKARALAQALSSTVPGVGVLERQVDAKTGDIRDELQVLESSRRGFRMTTIGPFC